MNTLAVTKEFPIASRLSGTADVLVSIVVIIVGLLLGGGLFSVSEESSGT
jgi:hypothetical protein